MTDLRKLSISTRTLNILLGEAATAEELAELTCAEMLRIHRLGRKGLSETRTAMIAAGITPDESWDFKPRLARTKAQVQADRAAKIIRQRLGLARARVARHKATIKLAERDLARASAKRQAADDLLREAQAEIWQLTGGEDTPLPAQPGEGEQ